MVKAIVGIRGFSFDASHYTPGSSEKCYRLHGHTYNLEVEVYGEINESNGMVIDFLILKKVVKEVIEEYDHKIIVPHKDLGKIHIEGPFKTEYKVIEYPYATTEYLALDIARKIYERIKLPVRVKLFEGDKNYVFVEWSG
jgi:6-pyruvoyltetrahydropterin/6-carboxytetrahydropterin synthase